MKLFSDILYFINTALLVVMMCGIGYNYIFHSIEPTNGQMFYALFLTLMVQNKMFPRDEP